MPVVAGRFVINKLFAFLLCSVLTMPVRSSIPGGTCSVVELWY